MDASQDISDLAAWAGNGLVGIEFTRPRVTPASNDDDISLDQSVYFLFAWGGSLNFDTRTLGQHTNANRQPSDAPYMIPANCVNGGEFVEYFPSKDWAIVLPNSLIKF